MNTILIAKLKKPSNPLFAPASNELQISSFIGVPYTWRWSTGVRSVKIAARAAEGVPGETDYLPAVAEVTEYTELQSGNSTMTAAQWAAWKSQADESYLLECAAEILGLELA